MGMGVDALFPGQRQGRSQPSRPIRGPGLVPGPGIVEARPGAGRAAVRPGGAVARMQAKAGGREQVVPGPDGRFGVAEKGQARRIAVVEMDVVDVHDIRRPDGRMLGQGVAALEMEIGKPRRLAKRPQALVRTGIEAERQIAGQAFASDQQAGLVPVGALALGQTQRQPGGAALHVVGVDVHDAHVSVRPPRSGPTTSPRVRESPGGRGDTGAGRTRRPGPRCRRGPSGRTARAGCRRPRRGCRR